jgi:hypothetical protein
VETTIIAEPNSSTGSSHGGSPHRFPRGFSTSVPTGVLHIGSHRGSPHRCPKGSPHRCPQGFSTSVPTGFSTLVPTGVLHIGAHTGSPRRFPQGFHIGAHRGSARGVRQGPRFTRGSPHGSTTVVVNHRATVAMNSGRTLVMNPVEPS